MLFVVVANTDDTYHSQFP